MRKIQIILICAAFLFLFASTAVTQITRETMTNAVVLEMVKAGVPESSIVLKIQASEPSFDTSARALIELSKQGVGQKILDAILEMEVANRVSQIKPNVQSNSKTK